MGQGIVIHPGPLSAGWEPTNSIKGVGLKPNAQARLPSSQPSGAENDGYCGAGTCADLTFHGGVVMHSALVAPVFWGGPSTNTACTAGKGVFDNSAIDPAAANPNDCAFAAISARYITDFCASSPGAFFANVNEYKDGSGSLGSCSDSAGAYKWYWDKDAFPENPLTDGDIQSEANAVRSTLGLSASPNLLILMFTPYGEGSCISSGDCFPTGNYCAYHSWEWSGLALFSTPFAYASLPDYGWEGCSVNNSASPNSDPWGDAEATGVDHESSEAFTDPIPGAPSIACGHSVCDGWYNGATGTTFGYTHENGDECNFDFTGTEPFDSSDMRLGAPGTVGDPFRVQSEWDNNVGGCTIDNAGSPAPVRETITPDKSTGTTARAWSFLVTLREAGETKPLLHAATSDSSWPSGTTVTFYATPTDDFLTVPFISAGHVLFCFDIACTNQVAFVNFAPTGTSPSYIYYQRPAQQPYMNVIGGGQPPPVTISYQVPPTCQQSCSGVGDSTNTVTKALPLSPSTIIYPVNGSDVVVPTCDPQGLNLGVGYCGTNFGLVPSERWDTGIASSCNSHGLCFTKLMVTGQGSVGAINYWNQFLVGVSYFTSDGSAPSSGPAFNYVKFGVVHSITMTTSTKFVWADAGRLWFVGPTKITGATGERWACALNLVCPTGTTTGSTTSSYEFFHQYSVTFTYTCSGASCPSGFTASPKTGWYEANTADTLTANTCFSCNGFVFASWGPLTGPVSLSSTTLKTTSMTVTGTGASVNVNFIPGVSLALSTTSVSMAPGGSVLITATIKGAPQTVTLAYSTTTAGISASFATDPVTDSVAGITDGTTISVSGSVAPGTYHITIIVTGADFVSSKVTVTITVT